MMSVELIEYIDMMASVATLALFVSLLIMR